MTTMKSIGQGSAVVAIGAVGAAAAVIVAQLAAAGVVAVGVLLLQ